MQKILTEIENKYNITISKYSELNGGWINKKYIIIVDDKKYVLKELSGNKFPKDYLFTLMNTLDLQNFLYKQKLFVPQIIMNKDYNLLTELSNGERYFIQEFLNGLPKNYSDLTYHEIKSIGKSLGLLHKYLEGYNIEYFNHDFMKYKDYKQLVKELLDRQSKITKLTPSKYIVAISNHEKILEDIANSKLLELQNLQVIHGDFTPDNILFLNNKVNGVIDFELSRVNTKLQDFGRILLSTTFEDNKFDSCKILHLINGYNEYNQLDKEDIVRALKMVWVNESNIWLQERYYRNYNPPKVNKFIKELEWISTNWFCLDEYIMKEICNGKQKVKKY